MFGYSEQDLDKIGGKLTLKEMHQQPEVWKKVLEIVKSRKEEIEEFLKNSVDENTQIIFSGAASSQYVGDSVYSYLISKGYDTLSVPTTDITENPYDYIDKNKKIILVSISRSGNSPESVATFELVKKIAKESANVVITCNEEGNLAKKAKSNKNDLLFLMPEEADDKGFGMTSSFSSMLLASYLIFDINDFDKNEKLVKDLIDVTTKSMEENYKQIKALASEDIQRVVYLGSSTLKGISEESSLKVIEYCAGKIPAFYSGPMAFRHGPKSILDKKTVVLYYMNVDPYSRKYDLDLIKEINDQKQVYKLVVIDNQNDSEIKKNCDEYYVSEFKLDTNNALLGLNYITYAHLFAFFKSIALNKDPDNPSPSGVVNRVVKGVTIYDLNK